jgi:hypothetical protein
MPQKIIKNFQDKYGKEKGKQIYYATANKQNRDPETFEKSEDIKEVIKRIIRETLSEVYDHNMLQEDYVDGFISEDYSCMNGYAYRLKECGVDTKMNYDNGKHKLLIRRDHLPQAIDSLNNSADDLGEQIAKRLNKRYFPKT